LKRKRRTIAMDTLIVSQHLKAGQRGLVGLKIEYKNALCGDILRLSKVDRDGVEGSHHVILSSAY
jgi:hypothetical protein